MKNKLMNFLKSFSCLLVFIIVTVLLLGSLSPIFFMRTTSSSYVKDSTNPQKPEFPSGIEKLLSKSSIDLPSKLPFSGFVENKGQVEDPKILYYYSNSEMNVGFGISKITFVSASQNDISGNSFSLTFPEAARITPKGITKKSHPSNFYYGNFHFTNIPSWDEVWYYDLYPQIDLRYYMTTEGLKYEFIVRPGGNPAQIIMKVNGMVILEVQPQTVTMRTSNAVQSVVFQDRQLCVFQADKTPITAQFIPKNPLSQSYGFNLGNYDPNQLLIIDPLWKHFITYLGGSGSDYANAIAIDNNGNSYITGTTTSSNFPTHNAYNNTFSGETDAFVTVLNATGTGFMYSTYLGGSHFDNGKAIALDTDGNCYITGVTSSDNFPTYNAINDTRLGGTVAFVTKLNTTGNIVFSTYWGGSWADEGWGIAVDTDGNCYITGLTYSPDFPTVNAFNDTLSADSDVYVTKLNATGTGLVYSTYLGGNDYEWAYGITVDINDNCYITGKTESSDFPTANAYQSLGGGLNPDSFVTKLNATGTGLVFSTYLGGSEYEEGYGIALNSDENCYVTGFTSSTDFPTLNAYNDTYNGGGDVYVTKFNMTGNVVFSTFLGGSGFEYDSKIVVDSAGNSYITGYTRSDDFPTYKAYQSNRTGSDEVFLTKMNATGTGLMFSTYLGGSNDDEGNGIAIDTTGNVFIAGTTDSSNFPTYKAQQPTYGGGTNDGFVAKLSAISDDVSPMISSVTQSPASVNIPNYDNVTITANVTDDLAGVQNVTLNYQSNETGVWSAWESILMNGMPYQATLRTFLANSTLRYYIQAFDWANNQVVSPIGAPTNYIEVNIIDFALEITTTPNSLNITEISDFYYDFNASITFPSNLTWTLSGNATTWLDIDPSSGIITGTANYSLIGVWNITTIVSAEIGYPVNHTTFLTVTDLALQFTEVTPNQPLLLYDIILLQARIETNTSLAIGGIEVEWWVDNSLLNTIATNSTGYSTYFLQATSSGTYHVEVKVPVRGLQADIYLPTTGLEFWFNGNDTEPAPVWLTLGDEYTINGQLVDEDGIPVPDVELIFIMNNISLSSLQTNPDGWMNSTQVFLTISTYKVTVLKNGLELSTGENTAELTVHVVMFSPVVTVISPIIGITESVVGKSVSFVGWVYFNETPPVAVTGVRMGLLVNGTQVDSLFSDSNGYVYFNYAFVDSGIYRVAFYYNEQSWGEIWVTVTAGYFASWTGPSTVNGSAGQELEFTIYVLSNTSAIHRSVTLILNNGSPVIGAEIEWFINDAYQNSTITGVDGQASFKYIFATIGFYRVVAKHEGQPLATFEVFISEAPKDWLDKFLEDNTLLFLVLIIIMVCFMAIGTIPPARRQVAKSYRKVKTFVGRKTIFGPRYCARMLTTELEEKFGREELHEAAIDPAKQKAIKREISAKLTRFPEFMTKAVDEKVEFTQKTTELILKRYKK
ncbi:MAG: SBBP repeat-containing protein [Candidatus Hodarchaeota archaeon]